MSDPNLGDFRSRIAKIEKDRAKGYGFEADGTLGRSHYYRPTRRRRALVGPLLVVLACAFGLKGVIHYKIGAESYDARVAQLMAGQSVERLGGVLLSADPVTLFIADRLHQLLH